VAALRRVSRMDGWRDACRKGMWRWKNGMRPE
jgi:hypothetical protein